MTSNKAVGEKIFSLLTVLKKSMHPKSITFKLVSDFFLLTLNARKNLVFLVNFSGKGSNKESLLPNKTIN